MWTVHRDGLRPYLWQTVTVRVCIMGSGRDWADSWAVIPIYMPLLGRIRTIIHYTPGNGGEREEGTPSIFELIKFRVLFFLDKLYQITLWRWQVSMLTVTAFFLIAYLKLHVKMLSPLTARFFQLKYRSASKASLFYLSSTAVKFLYVRFSPEFLLCNPIIFNLCPL